MPLLQQENSLSLQTFKMQRLGNLSRLLLHWLMEIQSFWQLTCVVVTEQVKNFNENPNKNFVAVHGRQNYIFSIGEKLLQSVFLEF